MALGLLGYAFRRLHVFLELTTESQSPRGDVNGSDQTEQSVLVRVVLQLAARQTTTLQLSSCVLAS